MATDPRLRRLLEEILDTGESPEVVTRSCPELLPQLLAELRHVRAVEEQVSALFPESNVSPESVREATLPPGELPQIPGYEIESMLGHGGMGVVYKGRHLKLNRPVAIKMLLAGACATTAERERFLREAEAAARLQHRNIVPVYDVGDHEGRLYFTMEFVDGGTLADQLAGAPQPHRKAAESLATLSDAVRAAHECGIVHRDLKPSNILLAADGTLKISDFGLARQMEQAAGLTLTGGPMGTPSYMSPEQARGDSPARGPSVDIYALGALFYELLTGRPPFRAESSSATLQQVISQEPVSPRRLNASVPRDLETICLKCLQKDPSRRYESATDLRDDVRRFLSGEPIVARPIGLTERIVRWTRRNRAGAGLLLTAAGLLSVATIFIMREVALASERRLERAAWQERLQFVVDLEQEGRFREARVLLSRVPVGGSDELRTEIASAIRDLDVAEKLEGVRIHRGQYKPGGGLDYDESSRQYQEIFREAGLGISRDDPALGIRIEDPEVVARRLKASTIRAALIAALDDWAVCAREEPRSWIFSVARKSDPDDWRNRVRTEIAWSNRWALELLAKEVNVREQPVTLMVAMGTRWRHLGGDPTKFLQRVYQIYPNDFWLNFELGFLYGQQGVATALSYDGAAVALRPDASAAHYNLAAKLREIGRPDEAFHHFERTVELEPAHTLAHIQLGELFLEKGQLDEAFSQFQFAAKLEPESAEPKNRLREVLLNQGHVEEVAANWAKALDSDASTYSDCDGYAELCLILGRDEEYQRVCRKLLTRFGSTTNPRECECLGRVLFLAPTSAENLQPGIALIDRALGADKSTYEDWLYPYFLFAKGLAEYRAGRYESAIAICTGDAAGVLGPAPGLVTALSQHRLGNEDAARQALAEAEQQYDWEGDPVRKRDGWLYFILRREALDQIGPNEQ